MIKYILISLLAFSVECFSQAEFEKFKSLFPRETLPFNSSSLNNYKSYDSISNKGNLLKTEQCISFLFNGDKRKVSYVYEGFNMETGESTGNKQFEYSFYPAFQLEAKDWLLLGFLRSDMNDYRYFVALFKQGESNSCDLIEINRVNEELLPDLIEYSLIEQNFKIRNLKFEINPTYALEIRSKDKSLVDKTLITVKTLDLKGKIGRYLTIKTEQTKSKCSVSDFQMKKNECEKQLLN